MTPKPRNDGTRAINRAHVTALVGCCIEGGEWRREWFPHLGPGRSAAFEASIDTTTGAYLTAVCTHGRDRA